jgi:hypothetical protein
VCLPVVLLSLTGVSGAPRETREGFGKIALASAEWEYVDDARLTADKLQEIVNAGVLPSEYFRYPWLGYRISEKEWLAKRRHGVLKGDGDVVREISSKEWAVVQNFFFPGLHQYRRKQGFKGFIMTSVALGSLALYALHKEPGKTAIYGFDYPAYLLVLAADQLWSSIDIGVQIHRELNPAANRFTSVMPAYQFSLAFNVPFPVRTSNYVQDVSQR